MKLEFASPDADACDTLAEQHCISLPTSTLSALGKNFLRAFYRFAAQSPMEQVIVCRRNGVPVAGALISQKLGSLNRRIVFKTPLIPAILSHLHLKAVRQAIFNRSVIQWDDAALDCGTAPSPELLALFCQADARGQGIGSALIEQVDSQLVAMGGTRYFVRTFEERDNPVLKFYIRHGFIPVGRIEAYGVGFALLMKNLPPRSKADLSE